MTTRWDIEKKFFYLRWVLYLLAFLVVFLLAGSIPAHDKSKFQIADKLFYMGLGGLAYFGVTVALFEKINYYFFHYFCLAVDIVLISLLNLAGIQIHQPLYVMYFFVILYGGYSQSLMVSMASTLGLCLVYGFTVMIQRANDSASVQPLAEGFKVLLFLACGYLVGLPFDPEDMEKPDQKKMREEQMKNSRYLEEQYNRSRALVKDLEKKTEELNDKSHKLETLMAIGRLMSTTRDLDALMELVVKQAKEWMNTQISFFLFVEGDRLEMAMSLGLSEASQQALSSKVGEGISGEVAQTGQPLRLAQKDEDIRFASLLGSQERIRNILCVPLKSMDDKKPFGVLGVANLLMSEEFTEEHEAYLMLLAADASVAYKNAFLLVQLERSYLEMILALAQAVEAKDPYTHGHIDRVRWLSVKLARTMNLDEDEQELIAKAAILHDVGKIGTPDHILLKPGPLDDKERDIMNHHTTGSYRILKDINSLDERVKLMVLHHHERYDGKGYPSGLAGDKIPLGAQIIAVSDTFDAMTSDRPYRKGFDPDIAIDRMKECGGTQFDPRVLKTFVRAYEKDIRKVWKKEE